MSDNKPSADELAASGEKRRKKKAEKKAKLQAVSSEKNAKYQRVLDQKRIFKHISGWYRWRLVFMWFGILCLFFAFPLFLVQSMTGNYFSSELWMMLMSPFIGLLILYILSGIMVKKKALKEKAWIDNLPYEIKGFPDFLVYRSYSSFDVIVEFERKVPKHEYFMNVFGTAPYEVEHEVSEDWDDSGDSIELPLALKDIMSSKRRYSEEEKKEMENKYKFEVQNSKGSKFDSHRRWAYKWVHLLSDTYLAAIHEQYPIKSVTIGRGTNELDYEWWIPLRQRGFLFLQ